MTMFSAPVDRWFETELGAPTRVQREGWQRVAAGDHTLMLAPTGSGKTLAAFLWCLDRLLSRPPGDDGDGVRVLYVSPLKALAYDVERNLERPLAGIRRVAQEMGQPVRDVRVDVRTGDTTAKQRRRQARSPGDILITTPESLYLVLGSQARETLRRVDTVIVDEIHAVAGGKRGVHLALSLERLCELTGREPQRIGLSATQRPLDAVARYLGGDRSVSIVDASEPPRIDVEIVVPVPDMTQPAGDAAADPEDRTSIWPSVYPRLLDLIRAHRSTIIFVNSRRLAERLAQHINELAGEEIVRAHHGSVARHRREQIEAMLKAGELPAITATSSLELGIDMGAVDLVIQIESPGSVARGLQRIGRAGHQVGATSHGRVFPKFRGDLLEAAVVVHEMAAGNIEPIAIPSNTLDVLAQQIVAMCADQPRRVEDLEAIVRRTHNFRDLSRDALVEVLDMLTGRYPSDRFGELRPRLSWNRDTDVLTARPGAKMMALVNAGTIPDRGLYAVHLGEDGPRLGELDEEMVYESRPGETFLLGASTWRIEEITRDRVIVSPAPGEIGKMPFWRGERPGRPVDLGQRIGALVGELGDRIDRDGDAAQAWLAAEYRLDPLAARNLCRYVADQRAATGTLPTDRSITVERYRDELGDWRITMLSPFGARVHAPWALALEASLVRRQGFHIDSLWTDDGIVLRFADADELPADAALFPDPDDVQRLVIDQLAGSALFAAHFRANAARALLLPRRRPGMRTPLYMQRLRAQNLMAVASEFPSFPITLETYRECLQDVFDMPALIQLLSDVRGRRVNVVGVETATASPFSRSLVFDYVAAFLYEGDTPLAERRAHALALDRHLLRDLLGGEELRDLLDPGAVAQVETELAGLADHQKARHADDLHDMLRRHGDLSIEEIAARSGSDAAPWLEMLERERRAVRVSIAGQERAIAIEDAARYRDALGIALPDGVPASLLASVDRALEALVARHARTHGPFVAGEPAARFGLPVGAIEPVLEALVAREELLSGEYRPRAVNRAPAGTAELEPTLEPGGGTAEARQLCDPDVLRKLKRRTLSVLRSEVAPVEPAVLARFLADWQGVAEPRKGLAALRDAIARLEGAPLLFSELEARILPDRVPDFAPRMLDELGAAGELVWVGCGAVGSKDGKVALLSRERAARLVAPPPAELPPELSGELHHRIASILAERGASFFVDLRDACGGATSDQVIDALWDLAWAGLVTNDTFAALRGLAARHRTGGRRQRQAGYAAGTGRWSTVAQLVRGPVSETERAHARAVALLDRYGVVSREAALAESVPGGFAAVSPVLRAMEEAGKVRRGYFVDGLGGAQYAHPGAVDRLRDRRRDDGAVLALAAVDPANPWGALMSWPATHRGDEATRPGRRGGATLISVGGEPMLFVEPAQRRLATFAGVATESLERAIAGLVGALDRARRRTLRLETIDGEPARSSRIAPLLERAGFRPEYKGLVLER